MISCAVIYLKWVADLSPALSRQIWAWWASAHSWPAGGLSEKAVVLRAQTIPREAIGVLLLISGAAELKEQILE